MSKPVTGSAPYRPEISGSRFAIGLVILIGSAVSLAAGAEPIASSADVVRLQVGWDRVPITPVVNGSRPVWLAGYGWGRKATGVHDDLYARTIVMADGVRTIALVSVDLVGLQLPEVLRIRQQLPDLDYVMVSSTHNHEGPDTIGIWGKSPFSRGVDEAYLDHVVEQVVCSVRRAQKSLQPATASYGTAADESLLDDSRLPIAKDGVLRALRFDAVAGDRPPLGIALQWNCHPEALGPENTQVTADFCAATIQSLESRFKCPVVYFTGAVGGLMAPPERLLRKSSGDWYREGEFDFAQAYGQAVAVLAQRALQGAAPVCLVPIQVAYAPIAIPVENPLYRTARLAGVLRRKAVHWSGDFHEVKPATFIATAQSFAVASEVACLRLGDVSAACIPGELYPELVYGAFPDPVEPQVDYPQAAPEPTIVELMPTDKWLLFGLANDELGYIIPQRQWDLQPPFAYDRSQAQYGEINSCSAQVAPIIMRALAE
jgi:hypothetical protein